MQYFINNKIFRKSTNYSTLRKFSVLNKYCRSRVFSSGLGDQGSKTQKMVLGAALLNTQHYKVQIKGKVEQSREWSSAIPYTSVL